MRVLFLCHRLPFPPKRGGKIRPFNIIRHLSESGHEVTVGSLARSEEEIEEGAGLAEHCHKVLVGRIGKAGSLVQMLARLPTRSPSSMGYFYSRSLHEKVRSEAAEKNFDLVFVHCSSAAQYARHVDRARTVLDFGDMDSQKWLDYSSFRRFPLSLGYWLEGKKLCAEEKRLARGFDLSTCTTRAEHETLVDLGAARTSAWFPNGVDSEFFQPTEEPYDPNLICFVGRMDYYPNQQGMVEFCNEVMPEIQSTRPETRLIIVGAEPSREIRDLGDRPGVSVTGTVPDVRDYVRKAALTVAPLRIARGTQNKILESMAMGVPVVCTSLAARGVDAEPGVHLLVADNVDEYRSTILRILDSPSDRADIGAGGRSRILSNHAWASSMLKLDSILNGEAHAAASI